jgi:hypothetical protein
MSYKELNSYCQTLPIYIRRNLIRDKILALNGINRLRVMVTTLDTTQCRGFYLSAQNTNHQFVQQHGAHVIVLARGLNRCWQRMVFVKELMHIFDKPLEATDTGDKFETSLSEMMDPRSSEIIPQTTSEINCFWMALAALCPEEKRIELQKDYHKGKIDEYGIALKFKIPQLYVKNRLFHPKYREHIDKLLV